MSFTLSFIRVLSVADKKFSDSFLTLWRDQLKHQYIRSRLGRDRFFILIVCIVRWCHYGIQANLVKNFGLPVRW
jgi:hypothetical protein